MRTRTAAALVFAASLALTACSASPGPAASGASPTAPAASGTATGGVPAALHFTTTTLDGQPFDGTSLYGHATILWFWAPWCGSCVADSKYVLQAIPQLPDGVQIIGVGTFSDAAGMHAFADQLGINGMTNLMDVKGKIALDFNLPALPSAAVIYADGYTATVPGSMSVDTILEIANKIAP